jgi:hypothetical protein
MLVQVAPYNASASPIRNRVGERASIQQTGRANRAAQDCVVAARYGCGRVIAGALIASRLERDVRGRRSYRCAVNVSIRSDE